MSINNYSDLIGQRLIGFFVIDSDENLEKYLLTKESTEDELETKLILLIGDDVLNCQQILLLSDNQDYHYYVNWRIMDISDFKIELNETYKSIGEIINDVWVDNNQNLDVNNINPDNNLWIEKVGTGDWLAKEDENYYYAEIRCNTKILKLGTVYHDCHYPDTIWDFI